MRDFFRASIAKGQGRANPLFPAQKTPRWKRLLFGFSALAMPVGGGVLGVHLLSQPQFKISQIDVTGITCLDKAVVQQEISAELNQRTAIFFSRGNKFLFSPRQLEDRLTNNLPINKVEISVDGPTLHVTIQEDVVMMLFQSAGTWLLVDLDGHVLRTLSADEAANVDQPLEPPALPLDKIPKVQLSETVPPELKEAIYPTHLLTALGDLDQGLKAAGLTPHRYLLDKRKDTWLSVDLNEKDYAVYIDLEHPIEAQLQTFNSIISQGEELAGMSYLDLRFGNRVYMK